MLINNEQVAEERVGGKKEGARGSSSLLVEGGYALGI